MQNLVTDGFLVPHLQTQPPFVADVVLLAVEMYKGVSLFATVGLALKLSLILIKVKPLKYEPIEQTSAKRRYNDHKAAAYV